MWAGGKTRLLKRYAPVWPEMSQYSTYVEPFLGGGAVFGNLVGQFNGEAVLGDVNADLVGVYQAVKEDPDLFIQEARLVAARVLAGGSNQERKALYYHELQQYWESPVASTLYPLMRLGFNGIWQTNKKAAGKFATPAGLLQQKDVTQVVDPELLHQWSHHLQHAGLHPVGYDLLPIPSDGKALIYLDPPYRGSFTSYGTVFGDEEQVRLVEWSLLQVAAGHTVLLANRHVEGDGFFEALLPDATFHDFDVTYTAGRRKRVEGGFEAKPAREFLAILNP